MHRHQRCVTVISSLLPNSTIQFLLSFFYSLKLDLSVFLTLIRATAFSLFIHLVYVFFSRPLFSQTNARGDVARFASGARPVDDVFKKNPKLEATRNSLNAKGFLRSTKAYNPPSDIVKRIDKICASQELPANDEARLEGGLLRFKIFSTCAEEFKHPVPNSLLCTIETVGDLKEFYQTAINTLTPLDALQKIELPKNLHVQYEYHRFHPDTDTMFGGKTAFPLSSTIVTGLKYKKKYKSYNAGDPFYSEYKKV